MIFRLITVVMVCLLLSPPVVRGQSLAEDLNQSRKSEVLRQIDNGVALMDSGKYREADAYFRYALNNLDVLPANLAFYIGKNSYFLGQYRQSTDWLNKYIALKGTRGMHYFEAVKYLKESEKEIIEGSGGSYGPNVGTDSLYSHNYVDCGDAKVTCPICKGRRVIIEEGKLSDQYKTCSWCNEKGLLTCEEYNLLLQGKLKPRTIRQQ